MEWISNWAGGIIVAVIIGTVIEMVLPEGNCKKYIKVVIGVYVLFTIVSPVISKFTGKTVSVSDILDLDKYIEEAEESTKVQNTIQNDNERSIMGIYTSGIKDDMKAKIEAKGYVVNSIDVEVANDDSYAITAITLEVRKSKVNNENKDDSKKEKTNSTSTTVEPVEAVDKIEVNVNDSTNNNNESSNKNVNEDNSNNDQEVTLSNSEKNELKDYLSSVYEVSADNISI